MHVKQVRSCVVPQSIVEGIKVQVVNYTMTNCHPNFT